MTPWYEWVFSGAGVAALVAVGRSVYQRKAKGKGRSITLAAGKDASAVVESPGSLVLSAKVINSPVAVGNNITQTQEVHHHHAEGKGAPKSETTEPTPEGLIQEIDAVVPFDQPHVRGKFVGLDVVWKLLYRSIDFYEPAGTVWVEQSPNSFPIIRFNLGSVPPEIKTATRGSVLLVRGTIKEIGGWHIVLEDDPEILLVKRA
jgi:hypothetical protein